MGKMSENANRQLRHIQLEINDDSYQHLRHFVDQYFCYTKGYVRKTGSPNWDAIVWKEYVSLAAKEETNRKEVVKEHVVPLKRITEELRKLAIKKEFDVNIEEIKAILDELLIFATITKEEDKRLRSLGLTSKMPEEYDLTGSEIYNNHFARYVVAGIHVEYVD